MKMSATLENLYYVDSKEELVHGEIRNLPTMGRMPAYAAGEISVSLRNFIHHAMLPGMAVGANAGFEAHLPHRGSFSPDAAYYEGPDSGIRFFPIAPLFVAEVRSENDYGPLVEQEMADKRADYFAAGTEVVWDVDLQGDMTVWAYHASNPENPIPYRRGEDATAEPAVPGWSMPVDDLFEN